MEPSNPKPAGSSVGKLTTPELKSYAKELIEFRARNVEPFVVTHAATHCLGREITAFDAHLVSDLIDRATITVSWTEAD